MHRKQSTQPAKDAPTGILAHATYDDEDILGDTSEELQLSLCADEPGVYNITAVPFFAQASLKDKITLKQGVMHEVVRASKFPRVTVLCNNFAAITAWIQTCNDFRRHPTNTNVAALSFNGVEQAKKFLDNLQDYDCELINSII